MSPQRRKIRKGRKELRNSFASFVSLCAFAVMAGLVSALPSPLAAQARVDHAVWDQLLHRHVSEGLVDYEGFRQERQEVERYLAALETADPLSWSSREEQLAFWINAYNANVVKGVLDHYLPAPSEARLPVAGRRQTGQAGPIASVKEVKGFFDRIRYRVAGRELTLNEIEGEGRTLGDWRIHFAVVCASSSCPPLRAEAYVAEQLEAQLTEQTRQFLDNPQRGMRIEDDMLWASKIFDWYTTDFIPPKELGLFRRLTPEKLLPRIEPYLDRHIAQAIRSKRLSISFLDYNWSLNAQHK